MENKEKKRKQFFLRGDITLDNPTGKKKVRYVEEQSKRERTSPVGTTAWESHSKDWIDRTSKENMRVVSPKSKKVGSASYSDTNKTLPENWQRKRNTHDREYTNRLKFAASRRLGVK